MFSFLSIPENTGPEGEKGGGMQLGGTLKNYHDLILSLLGSFLCFWSGPEEWCIPPPTPLPYNFASIQAMIMRPGGYIVRLKMFNLRSKGDKVIRRGF